MKSVSSNYGENPGNIFGRKTNFETNTRVSLPRELDGCLFDKEESGGGDPVRSSLLRLRLINAARRTPRCKSPPTRQPKGCLPCADKSVFLTTTRSKDVHVAVTRPPGWAEREREKEREKQRDGGTSGRDRAESSSQPTLVRGGGRGLPEFGKRDLRKIL